MKISEEGTTPDVALAAAEFAFTTRNHRAQPLLTTSHRNHFGVPGRPIRQSNEAPRILPSDGANDEMERKRKHCSHSHNRNRGIKKYRDNMIGTTDSGHKIAADWQEINLRLTAAAEKDLVAARASFDPAKTIVAQGKLQRIKGDKAYQKTDHNMELIWCAFREFVAVHLNKTQPALYNESPKVDDIVAFLNYNFRRKDVKLMLMVDGNPRKVNCKGNKISSLQKYRQAFEWAFVKCSYPNLFEEKSVKEVYMELKGKVTGKYRYQPKQAKTFSVWSDFDKLREYCLKEKGDLYHVRSWTMILVMFSFFLRRADLTYLTVDCIGIPRSRIDGSLNLDEDGYPRILRLWLPKSKGDGEAEKGGVMFEIIRNYRDRDMCPVVALLDWLNFSGIKDGFVFPNFQHGSNSKFRNGAMSVDDISTMYSKLCLTLFGENHGYSTHSPRRTAAAFAAVCGATDAEIKRAGRWKSDTYMVYVAAGRARSIMELVGLDHPPEDRWSWYPIR